MDLTTNKKEHKIMKLTITKELNKIIGNRIGNSKWFGLDNNSKLNK